MRNFDNDEYLKIKLAFQEFRLPLIARLFKKAWFGFIRYSFLPAIIILVALFSVYNSLPYYSQAVDTLWVICKSITFVLIFGVGGLALMSHIFEHFAKEKLRKTLGLTDQEFNYFVIIFQAKGY